MKKEIIQIDKEAGVFRVTTTDERWYPIESKNKETGLPEYQFYPSSSWISGFYPKGIPFYKWLADKGWNEAEAIKSAAGDKGSKVHKAIEMLIKGGTVSMDTSIVNAETGKEEEITVEEYECVMSFANWANTMKPEFLLQEKTLISKKHAFAGTLDCLAKIGDQLWIIDFKTSQYVWPEHELQISSYKQALTETTKYSDVKLAILQVGYKRNKNMYKFTEVEDKFDLFLHAKAIWSHETEGEKPRQRDYPLSLTLELNKE